MEIFQTWVQKETFLWERGRPRRYIDYINSSQKADAYSTLAPDSGIMS